MKHFGGSSHYVEGERVFAPPQGVFDSDWVAGILLDRGETAGRLDLARAAQLIWTARCEGDGVDRRNFSQEIEMVVADGFGPRLAAAIVQAVDDYVTAYDTSP
ncbi:MAG: hypothetical protein ACRYF3_08035 [Janthinobacterium lividum]